MLEKTKCLVTKGKYTCNKNWHAAAHDNKSFRIVPEVLNSLSKNASNEISEYLHDKIRKHAMKEAKRNHSVFPCSSANFLSRGLLSCPWHKSTFKKVMLKLKERLQIVSQLHL